jgi:hypothetical protein
MYIGSGDVAALMAGKETDTHAKLLRRFVSGEKPYYNAKNSPIDALRTGAILEERYDKIKTDDYYAQYVVQSTEMDVLKASIDFAKLDAGKVIDFDELKTVSFDDFLTLQSLAEKPDSQKEIKKRYKKYYYQIQQQLYCTGIDEANLVFLVVYSYDDEENYNRDVQPNECLVFRIHRDEEVINAIKERAQIFQQIKNYYYDKN